MSMAGGELVKTLQEVLAACSCRLHESFGPGDVDDCGYRGRGQRVVLMTRQMVEPAIDQRVVDLFRDDDATRGKTVSRSLRKDEYVRRNLEVFAIEPSAAAAKPCLRLVN